MRVVERAGEVVTRRVDRRAFLRKTAAAAFGITAAWAVEGIGMTSAFANSCQRTETGCSCSPLGWRSRLGPCSGRRRRSTARGRCIRWWGRSATPIRPGIRRMPSRTS